MLRRPLLWAPDGDAGVGGIDDTCLALIRPVYSGGVWAPGDASLYKRTVTNNSLTIGAEGSGPWGGTSRAIEDAAVAYRATVPLSGITIRSLAIWVYPTVRPTDAAVIWGLQLPGSTNSRTYLSLYPGATGRVRVSATSVSGAVIFNVYSAADFPLNEWIFASLVLPAGTGPSYLRINGALANGATTASTTPVRSVGGGVMMLGAYAYNPNTYSAVAKYAEAIVTSDPRWDSDFDPPTGPYTED